MKVLNLTTVLLENGGPFYKSDWVKRGEIPILIFTVKWMVNVFPTAAHKLYTVFSTTTILGPI